MGCDFPLKAFRSATPLPTGKYGLTFNPLKSMQSTGAMEIPCNNCMGCKLEKSRQWAIRMTHESKLYDHNCFLTLTYSNENVPQDYGLHLRHWQLFMKKLRRALPQKIRFFACGEYGDLVGRPHYHAIIFNYDPPDKKLWCNINGKPHYVSETLSRVWDLGFITSADVTYESCAYVARYVTKKIKTGDTFGADRYYRVSPVDGIQHQVRPEFAVMSRRPGIGSEYIRRFKSDFYPSGFVVVDGVKHSPPKYYLSKLTEKEQLKLKQKSYARITATRSERTMERRLARAAVRDARITRLKRNFEG